MSTRTTYTSTISVPVYASWKCEKCGEINFSGGVIACRRSASTSSFRSSKLEEAKSKAFDLAQAGWARHVLKIISDPNNNAWDLRRDFFLQNTKCTKCGAKPKWDKDTKYEIWVGLSIMVALFSGFAALITPTNVIVWLIFLASLSGIIYGLVADPLYKRMMHNLPREYTPVIGSLNIELIEYANHHGKSIPTPNESFEIVRNYGTDIQFSSEVKNPPIKKDDASLIIGNSNSSCSSPKADKYMFCRKCGTKLLADSDFCHKCGTEIIRQDLT